MSLGGLTSCLRARKQPRIGLTQVDGNAPRNPITGGFVPRSGKVNEPKRFGDLHAILLMNIDEC